MSNITDAQKALLALIARDGGYCANVADAKSAEECVDRQWLMPEGESGYALTVEGAHLAKGLA